MTEPAPIEMSAWQGRIDAADGRAGLRWHQAVRALTPGDARPGVALIGFACDAGVRRNHGRPGSAGGPTSLRRQLANLAWHGGDATPLYDAGDAGCTGDALESAQLDYAARVAQLLRARHRVIGLGGGHEIAWATYQGLAMALADDPRLARLGVVNFDAHFDLRPLERAGMGTSGTPFLQIAQARAAAGFGFHYLCLGISEAANTAALFERAHSFGTRYVSDVEIGDSATDRALTDFIASCDSIYCTFCLDVLPAASAPGVSAPAALGVPVERAVGLLRRLVASCRDGHGDKLVMADVAELNPTHDAADQRTARTAARIVYELAGVHR